MSEESEPDDPVPPVVSGVPHHVTAAELKNGSWKSRIGLGKRTDFSKAVYHEYWELWCHGASAYTKLQHGGCRLSAQAKILVEMGFAPADTSRFNPDIYLEWGEKNGYFMKGTSCDEYWKPDVNTGVTLQTGAGVIAWAASKGHTVVQTKIYLSGDSAADEAMIMEHLRAGEYAILICDAHHAYVGQHISLDYGRPILLDSQSDCAYNWSCVRNLDGYSFGDFEAVCFYRIVR